MSHLSLRNLICFIFWVNADQSFLVQEELNNLKARGGWEEGSPEGPVLMYGAALSLRNILATVNLLDFLMSIERVLILLVFSLMMTNIMLKQAVYFKVLLCYSITKYWTRRQA